MKHARQTTADLAQGRWPGILRGMGVPERALSGKHGPCPFCGGKDRFRFDNKEGKGSFICGQCGAGDGFDFLMRFRGWDFKTCAAEIDRVVTGISPAPIPKPESPEAILEDKRRLWVSSRPVERGDAVSEWLRFRGVGMDELPPCLRTIPSVRAGGTECAAMLSLVEGDEGCAPTLHSTYLRMDGGGKADIPKVRMLFRGETPKNAAVRLGEKRSEMGVAEGIETALAASRLFGMTVWACLNAALLSKWTPPEGVSRVTVFGDNDANFAGQSAAYVLANRLYTQRRIGVRVEIPPVVGEDWNDVLMIREGMAA